MAKLKRIRAFFYSRVVYIRDWYKIGSVRNNQDQPTKRNETDDETIPRLNINRSTRTRAFILEFFDRRNCLS